MSNSAQQRTAHVPPHRTDDDVLGLAEDLSQLGQAGDLVAEYLQKHLGLSDRDLHALARLAEEPTSSTEQNTAEQAQTGAEAAGPGDRQPAGPATPGDLDPVVLTRLEQRGLATHGEGGQGFVVTEKGLVISDQVDAMRIRIADHLVSESGPDRTHSLRSLVEQMVQAIPNPVHSIA